MSIPATHSPQNSHTVVLKRTAPSVSQPLIIGSKQESLSCARGSPPRGSPPVVRGRTHTTLPRLPTRPIQHQETLSKSTDLLVRFGIDSYLGRVVARTLVWLMLFQPVYVAMGMEIEDPAAENAPVQSADIDTTTDGDTAADELPDVMVPEDPELAEVVEEEITQEEVVEKDDPVDSESEISDDEETTEEDAVSDEPATEEESENGTTEDSTSEDTTGTDGDSSEEDSESAPVEEGTDEESSLPSEPVDSEEGVNDDTQDSAEGDVDSPVDTPTENTEDDESADDTDTSSGGGGGSSSGGGGSGSTEDESDPDESADDTGDSENVDEEETTSGDTAEEDVICDPTVLDENGEPVVCETESDTEVCDETAVDENGEPIVCDTDTEQSEEELLAEDENVVVVQNSENKYTFGEGDCTLVSDGEFYCVAAGPDTHQMTGDPRVYSEKDREGDREIFYFDGVEIQRVTNNSYDDFAPVYDEETQTIVWQAMLNDRLQVMMHELPTNTTRQITTSRQNSSNPNIAGYTVVWQEWVDTNWEVMMTNINNGGGKFEIERLTDNAVHDMFPQAYDDLVTWQSERGDSWEVVVYDLRTGKRQALEKSEDTKYENPRFVLLFDSKHENGDVETIGYDLDTGEMMELGTKAAPIPADPATPDDETQDALPREVNNSTQIKVNGREDDTPDDTL